MKISSKKERDEFFRYITEVLPSDPVLIRLNLLVIAYLCAGIMVNSETGFRDMAGQAWNNAVKLLEGQVLSKLPDIDEDGNIN